MGAIAFQFTSLTIVYSTVNSDADQRKHQSSASLAFVRGFHRGPVNSPQKGPVKRKMFPFDDVIMTTARVGYMAGIRYNNRYSVSWASYEVSIESMWKEWYRYKGTALSCIYSCLSCNQLHSFKPNQRHAPWYRISGACHGVAVIR